MIVRPRPNLFELFFIIKGSIVLRIMPLLVFVAILSATVVSIYTFRPDWLPKFDGGPFALLGITLSIFLAFRNNACYERWWEARKIWGEFVLTCRNLSRLSVVLDAQQGEASPVRKSLLQYCIAYAHALLMQLRPASSRHVLEAMLPEKLLQAVNASRNPPEMILRAMQALLVNAFREAKIDVIQFQMLDDLLQKLAQAQASCERIQNTPIPFGYPCCYIEQPIPSAFYCRSALPTRWAGQHRLSQHWPRIPCLVWTPLATSWKNLFHWAPMPCQLMH